MMDTENKKTVLDDGADIYSMPEDGEVSEHSKWEALNRRERVQYFKDYYFKKIIVGAIVLAVMISIIVTIVKPHPRMVVSAAVVNDCWDDAAVDSLTKNLSSAMKLDPDKAKVFIDDSYFFGKSNARSDEVTDDTGLYEKFMTYLMAGDINCLILDRSDFEKYTKDGYFMPVKDILGKDTDKYSDRFVNGKSDDDSESKVYGISLKGSPVLKNVGAYQLAPVIAFTANSKEEDRGYLRQFAEYMLK